MALYTPPSLPHTPSTSYQMNATLRPLPIELVSTWSTWRPNKTELPLTPPLSAVPQRRVAHYQPHLQTTLPPISHLEQKPSRVSPLTPPQSDDASQWHSQGPAAVRLPPVHASSCSHSPVHATRTQMSSPDQDVHMQAHPPIRSPPAEPVDWVMKSTLRTCQFLAEKTCEMICYLWFSSLSRDASSSSRPGFPSMPEPNSATASLQLAVSPVFVRFMQKVLETTQVSQSVIVLALHYIYRLKIRNRYTNGQSGSEFRVAIAALMMANKFLDDNTYTNKTWSEVSGIGLEEINRMEREFLLGIDFGLYVDKSTYVSWLNLLKGLVSAKEKDTRHWRRTPRARVATHSKAQRAGGPRSQHAARAHRARSSSPSRTSSVTALPAASAGYVYRPAVAETYTPPRSNNKRSATDAFSPTSSTFAPIKQAKRPTGLSLDIPEPPHGQPSVHSISPSEPLNSFSKLSLGASPCGVRPAPAENISPAWPSSVQQHVVPQTLASAYRIDEQRTYATPQNLYFYSLACSPTEEENRSRKARLWYHQPPMASADYGCAAQPSVPMVVQSACASPHEVHGHLRHKMPTLPHFSELTWDRPRAPPPTLAPVNQSYHPHHHHQYHHQSQPAPSQVQTRPHHSSGNVPSAPFANAGPPGVHFYYNDAQSQRTSPVYNRSRGHLL